MAHNCTITDKAEHGINDLLLFTNPTAQGFTASAHNVVRSTVGRWHNISDQDQCRNIDVVTDTGTRITFSMFRKRPAK